MPDIKNSRPGKFDGAGAIAFLRRAFPQATAQHVSAVTGISSSTVDKWLRGISAPGADHLSLLVAAFGPRFLAVAFPVTAPWLAAEEVRRDVRQALTQLRGTIERARRLEETAA